MLPFTYASTFQFPKKVYSRESVNRYRTIGHFNWQMNNFVSVHQASVIENWVNLLFDSLRSKIEKLLLDAIAQINEMASHEMFAVLQIVFLSKNNQFSFKSKCVSIYLIWMNFNIDSSKLFTFGFLRISKYTFFIYTR